MEKTDRRVHPYLVHATLTVPVQVRVYAADSEEAFRVASKLAVIEESLFETGEDFNWAFPDGEISGGEVFDITVVENAGDEIQHSAVEEMPISIGELALLVCMTEKVGIV